MRRLSSISSTSQKHQRNASRHRAGRDLQQIGAQSIVRHTCVAIGGGTSNGASSAMGRHPRRAGRANPLLSLTTSPLAKARQSHIRQSRNRKAYPGWLPSMRLRAPRSYVARRTTGKTRGRTSMPLRPPAERACKHQYARPTAGVSVLDTPAFRTETIP